MNTKKTSKDWSKRLKTTYRKKSTTANHGIKVYETVYSVAATDVIKDTQTIAPPGKVTIAVVPLSHG